MCMAALSSLSTEGSLSCMIILSPYVQQRFIMNTITDQMIFFLHKLKLAGCMKNLRIISPKSELISRHSVVISHNVEYLYLGYGR